jgi:predicted Zn-dependent protease
MLQKDPENPTGLLALANEYGKAGRHEDEAGVLRRYLAAHEDEGNAYARLGRVLAMLGRREEAREALREGVERARRHDHREMAGEMLELLRELG